MKYHVIAAGLLLPVLTLLFSCIDEAAPEAYQGDEPVVHETTLPQGNHDYDNTIMDWHKKYGVYPLYKFSDEDWFWSVTGDIRWSYDASRDQTNAGYKIYQGEETQVGNLISLLQQRVFCYFPDSVLKSILPQKMLLAGRIVHNPGSLHGEVPESQYEDENTLAGFDYVAFAGATEKIRSMTRKDSVGFTTDAVSMLIEQALKNGRMSMDPTFASLTDYTATYTAASALRAGLFTQYTYAASQDWMKYVQTIVSTPYSVMQTKYLNKYPMMAQKYKLVVDYFLGHYNIDLQQIGNESN